MLLGNLRKIYTTVEQGCYRHSGFEGRVLHVKHSKHYCMGCEEKDEDLVHEKLLRKTIGSKEEKYYYSSKVMVASVNVQILSIYAGRGWKNLSNQSFEPVDSQHFQG